MPAITLKDPYIESNKFNDLDFSLVSPDNVPLLTTLNRSSPEFTNNIFFGNETGNLINSPYKDPDAVSESNYKPVSPRDGQSRSPFGNNYKANANFKAIASNESSVSNLFGSPSPRNLVQPLQFNYDESVFGLAERGSIMASDLRSLASKGFVDFNLNLFKPKSNNLKVDEVKPVDNAKPASVERFSLSVQTELKHLDRLFNLLVKIFTKKEIIEIDLMLSPNELRILNYFLNRKYLKRLTSKDLEASTGLQIGRLNSITSSKSHKRPEECYKFIFTRVLKFLKKSFKKNFNIKQNLDDQFYGYYFGELAQKNNESLDSYFYPLTKKDNKKETLNSSYFGKIFQSKNFINDLVKYINEHLNEEYKTEIIQKLESLLLKWDRYFFENDQKVERHVEEIKLYLMKNKRCKLPWTLDEVKEAVLRVYSLIDTHSNSNLSVTLEKSGLFQ